MAISGRFLITGSAEHVLDVPENRSGSIFDSIYQAFEYADGVAAGQCDIAWSNRQTVLAGATDVIDLSPLTLNAVAQTDPFGVQPTFVEVVCIIIRNTETTAGTRTLHFGPNAPGNPFLWLFVDQSDLAIIVPGGAYCMWTDEPVDAPIVAGVNDSLRIINTDGANNVTYDILIVGRSA